MREEKDIDLFYLYKNLGDNINISYKGPFNSHILSFVGEYIKLIINNNPKASKKLFKIFIELAQNIAYYSAEVDELFEGKEDGVGVVAIGEFEEYYTLHAGNLIHKQHAQVLEDKCNYINSLDKDSLREYKRTQRNLPQNAKDGANIGLIHSALTSDNPLIYKLSPVNEEHSFFALTITVMK